MCGLLLSDCHFFQFGVRITDNDAEHEVVIIDAGSRGVATITLKKKLGESMHCEYVEMGG